MVEPLLLVGGGAALIALLSKKEEPMTEEKAQEILEQHSPKEIEEKAKQVIREVPLTKWEVQASELMKGNKCVVENYLDPKTKALLTKLGWTSHQPPMPTAPPGYSIAQVMPPRQICPSEKKHTVSEEETRLTELARMQAAELIQQAELRVAQNLLSPTTISQQLGVLVTKIPDEVNQYYAWAKQGTVDFTKVGGVHQDIGYSVGVTLPSGTQIGFRFNEGTPPIGTFTTISMPAYQLYQAGVSDCNT